jgi:hypothetical protein
MSMERTVKSQKKLFNTKVQERRNVLMRKGGSSCSSSSSSSSSSLSSCFYDCIGPEDSALTDVDRINRLYIWGEFQKILEDIKERKREHRVLARQGRIEHRYVAPSPYMSYPAEAMENLWFKK